MIYHLIGLSPYTNNLIKMMVSHQNVFNLDKHVFFIDTTGSKTFKIEDLGEINHTMLDNPWGFLSLFHRTENKDSIIIHQLANPRLFLYLFLNRGILKKCVWSVWGGDVYFFMNRSDSIKDSLVEFLRKAIIPRIPLITSWLKGDYDVIRTVYKSRAEYISSFYPLELDYDLINKLNCRLPELGTGKPLTILVGNSGDPDNNHFDVLECLSRFKRENIIILTPLSYGDKDHIESVLNYGRSVFGNKFRAVLDFMPATSYISMLSEVDVAIMNSNRPHALGNVITLLLLKKKVFLKGGTVHYNYLVDKGITVFDVELMSYQEIDEMMELSDEEKYNNSNVMADIISEKNAVENWKNVFDYCHERAML